MFGYLRPYKPELKVKEYALYKAVYCGLCHSLGRRYGLLSRVILSYDATLMCLIGLGLKDGCGGFETRRCPFNPHKKCDVARADPVLDYWADASIILGYYKVKDNLHDGGFKKKAASLLALPFVSALYRKAAKKNPFIGWCAGNYIEAQEAVERGGCVSVDRAAEPTAALMSALLSHCAKNGTERRVLERMGLFLGRWIYLADAADDVKKDAESGAYNPFLAGRIKDEKAAAKAAEPLLNSCVYEITAAFGLLEFRRFGAVVANAFYLGLPEVKKAVLAGLPKKEKIKRFAAVYRI